VPVVNVSTLRTGLGRPDSKFPVTPPQASAAELGRILTNNWGLVGTHISRAEAAWLLEVGTHPNADAALRQTLAARASSLVLGSSARQLGFDQWLASIGGTPSAPSPTAPSPAASTTTPGALTGRLIPQDATKVVSTASHDISFATVTGGEVLPDMQIRRRDITDPEVRPAIAQPTAAELAAVRTGADFKALLTKMFDANKAYLIPDRAALMQQLSAADQSNYSYLNLSGRRLEQFFNEVQRELPRTALSGTEAKTARMAINQAYRDAFRGRTAAFDRADTGTYWSYGHDAAFVHVFEKMLESLPPNDPKRAPLQAQVDFIFANKYVPNGRVVEGNIEESLELVAIDKRTRDVVSMTPDSDNTNTVRYETLKSGGRAAHRDGTQYFWQGTRTELTAAEKGALVRTPTASLTFRRATTGEQTRSGFRYDWDKNRMINAKDVDTGWWGHCDIKALIETILADMAKSRGLTEFRSDTMKNTEFTREMQLEALAALLNFDDRYSSSSGGVRQFGVTNFAGGRNDDTATTMALTTDRGQSFQLPIRLTVLSEKDKPGTLVDVKRAFNPKIADAQNQSFTDNPDVRIDPQDPDIAAMTATGRKIGGTTDGYTFNERGEPVEAKTNFEIDPTATAGDKVLIGTELTDIAGRALQRIYYNPATKDLSAVTATFIAGADGKFLAHEGTPQSLGKLRGVELGAELKAGDDVQAKLAMLEEAVRTGKKIATDSDTGMQVWNGEVHAIRKTLEWRSPDGRWEREGVTIDATFGSNKVGTFLHKLDDEGRIIESMEVNAAVDFYWADNPRIAPLISERGNWWVNKSMQDRGVVTLGAGKMASLGAMQDLMDLVYLGLSAKGNAKVFTIVHEGKRYVYDTEAAWKADVDKIRGAAPPSPGGGGGSTTGPIAVSRSANLSVPDNDPNGITDSISVDRAGAIKGVKVDIDLKHTYIGDLDVALIAPDGTKVKLHARGGRDKDDLVGSYGADLRAIDDLAVLNGKDAKGNWQLKIVDLAGQDVGNLVSWGLKIDV
jgi:subtilisin-like proprotein convertase family protein